MSFIEQQEQLSLAGRAIFFRFSICMGLIENGGNSFGEKGGFRSWEKRKQQGKVIDVDRRRPVLHEQAKSFSDNTETKPFLAY